MLKVFYIFTICYICYSQVYSGLIDTLAEVSNKNATIAESLPKKKNYKSKYACLKNNNKKPLETVIDAHSPVNFTLQKAAEQKVDVNKLSEKQLEAIGDAAIAEKLAETPKSTSESTRETKDPQGTSTSKNKQSQKSDECGDVVIST